MFQNFGKNAQENNECPEIRRNPTRNPGHEKSGPRKSGECPETRPEKPVPQKPVPQIRPGNPLLPFGSTEIFAAAQWAYHALSLKRISRSVLLC